MQRKQVKMSNRTYEFIGQLAVVLFSQNITISYSTLIRILEDNGYETYGSERGMASGIAAAYHEWERAEKEITSIPTTCCAIANTFVNKDGYPSWLDY
ncbi:MAG: hypothetical protein J5632_02880 [Bacteroidales bacterium]|nr:hypothetical protein [Bacteroidales bacterium]